MSKTKIGLGLAAIGRPEYINIRTDHAIDKSEAAFKKNAHLLLDEAYKLGVRYFDTAPSYGNGEAYLGQWNSDRNYDDVVLGTKWGYTYVANWELGFNGKHEVKEHSLEKLLEQWEVSKHRFPKLTYYQVHSATFESGILENEAILNQLYQIKNGASDMAQLRENLKALHFNFTADELQELKNLKANPEAYWGERADLNWN